MNAVSTTGRIVANKYRLAERIGVGGMSEVYRAEDLVTGRIVAVKLLLPHKLEDPSFVARLFQEAHSGFRMSHPGIVEVHEAGQSEFGPYLVMDFFVGESAGRRLFDHGKYSRAAAIATIVPILDALQSAHDTGVVHRDIKPGNIFYSVEGARDVKVKLLDFGVAKVLWPGGASARTSTGVVMGTPDYLSPEQASGELHIDGRSDVFGAGVVLFEFLTASRPFHAPTAVATAYKVAHARTPLLVERGGPDDPTLQAIISRALAKRPDERYGSARELARDLEALEPDRAALGSALIALVKPERFLGKRREGSGERPASQPEPLEQQEPAVPTEPGGQPTPSFPAGWTPPAALARGNASVAIGAPQVRGLALRSVDRYVREVFGAGARRRALESVPEDVVRELEYDSMQAIVLYDVEAFNRYCVAVSRVASMGSVGWARSAGSHAVHGELGAILKNALRSAQAHQVVRRVYPLLSRLFSFGAWSFEEGATLSTLRIADVEPLAVEPRFWLVGVIDGALAAAGVPARATVSRGDVAHAPHCMIDIRAP